MSVAGAGVAECPTCHTSPKYKRPHPPQWCSRYTTYPVLCPAALAHREILHLGMFQAPSPAGESAETAASLLSHTIHVSFTWPRVGHMLVGKKKNQKECWQTDLHYRTHLWIENRLQGSQPKCRYQQLLKIYLQKKPHTWKLPLSAGDTVPFWASFFSRALLEPSCSA